MPYYYELPFTDFGISLYATRIEFVTRSGLRYVKRYPNEDAATAVMARLRKYPQRDIERAYQTFFAQTFFTFPVGPSRHVPFDIYVRGQPYVPGDPVVP